MPVTKKSNGMDQNPVANCHRHLWGEHDFAHKIILTLVGVLLAYLIIFFGSLIRNNMREHYFIGRAPRQERTIRVEAQGKVVATPDVAMTTIGMIVEATTVADAQQKNTMVMNSLIQKLKDLGVAPADIQTTNYTISPRYNYTQERGQELVGYEVSQNVTVKIRDLEKANTILALAGEVGVNSVSGLTFTIDDREVYLAEAREKALQKLGEKARNLGRSLGVNLISIVSYDEYEEGSGGPVLYNAYAKDMAMGGAPAPSIESGSLDVILTVGVTFEIR